MIKKGFLGLLNFLFSHLLFRVKYVNLENVKKIDKGVVCPNHSCIFDPFWVYFKVENMWIMAKAELFKNKLMAKIYAELIRKGLRTIDQVPLKLQPAVKAILEGGTVNGE